MDQNVHQKILKNQYVVDKSLLAYGWLVIPGTVLTVFIIALAYHNKAKELNSEVFYDGVIIPSTAKETLEYSVCTTDPCKEQAKHLVSKELSLWLNPCDNFYEYVCGQWKRHNPVSSDKVKITTDDIIFKSYGDLLTKALRTVSDEAKYIRLLHKQCLEPYDTLYAEVANSLFAAIGLADWPYSASLTENLTDQEISRIIGEAFRQTGIQNLFKFSLNLGRSDVVYRNILIEAVEDTIPSLSLGLNDIFEDMIASMDLLSSYLNRSNNVDFNAELVERLVSKISDLDTASNLNLITKHYRSSGLDKMGSYNYIHWKDMISTILGIYKTKNSYKINITIPSELRQLSKENLPKRHYILNYITFRICLVLLPLMKNTRMRHRLLRMQYSRYLEIPATTSQEQLCLGLFNNYEPYIPMYLAYNETLKIIGNIQTIKRKISLIISFFHQHIMDSKIYSYAQKRELHDNMNQMVWQLFMPKVMHNKTFLKTYLTETYNLNSNLSNAFRIWIQKTSSRKVSFEEQEHLWTGWLNGFKTSYPTINQHSFTVEVPAPVFDITLPNSTSIVFLQVPRLTHRIYYKLFELLMNMVSKTPSSEAYSYYLSIGECLTQQYAEVYWNSTGYHRNLEKTAQSNLLDLLAVSLGLHTFLRKDFSSTFKEARWLDRRAIYFIYYAKSLCENYDNGYLKEYMSFTRKAPGYIRVNGPLRNMKQFSEAFRCKLGTFMNPVEKCDFI